MTPLEIDLLKLASPYIAAAFAGIAGLSVAILKAYVGSIIRRLDATNAALSTFGQRLTAFETDMRNEVAEIKQQTQHRSDVIAGNVAARLERIEGVCETQHGIRPMRRREDKTAADWLQSSDITGNKHP